MSIKDSPDLSRRRMRQRGSFEKVRDDFEKDNPKWKFAEGQWERKGGVLIQSGTVDSWAVAVIEEKDPE
jgi:hypothetical protein